MRFPRRRRAGHVPAPDPDLAAARERSSESGRRADSDLAYQRARAQEEYAEIAVPLRRFRTDVNHIAEMIADSLAPRQNLPTHRET